MAKYKVLDEQGLNFITLTIVGWVDVFIRKTYKDLLIDNLRYCQQKKGLVIHAYVVMSSHVHLIVSTDGKVNLSNILHDFKTFTAKQLLREIQQLEIESRTRLVNGLLQRTRRTK